MLGDAALATRMANALLDEGIYVIGFFYPGGAARARRASAPRCRAAHTDEHIDQAVAAFAKVGQALGVIGGNEVRGDLTMRALAKLERGPGPDADAT